MTRDPLADLGLDIRKTLIALDDITADPEVQPRASMSREHINKLADKMTKQAGRSVYDKWGVEFDPLVVFFESPETYWLASGFHRYYAAKQNGYKDFQCHIIHGGKRAATEYGFSTNHEDSLGRTPEDFRKIIRTILEDDQWRLMANGVIADMLKVNQSTVSRHRKRLEEEGVIPKREYIVARDGEVLDADHGKHNLPKLDSPDAYVRDKSERVRQGEGVQTTTTPATPTPEAKKPPKQPTAVEVLGEYDVIITKPRNKDHWNHIAYDLGMQLVTGGLIVVVNVEGLDLTEGIERMNQARRIASVWSHPALRLVEGQPALVFAKGARVPQVVDLSGKVMRMED